MSPVCPPAEAAAAAAAAAAAGGLERGGSPCDAAAATPLEAGCRRRGAAGTEQPRGRGGVSL